MAGLVLIGTAIRGAPYPELAEGPTAELSTRIEAADSAGQIDEVARLDAWMWLDGPSAVEGRVSGPARELFLEMNGRALRAPDPGAQAEPAPAWPRLGEISIPTLVMIGRLNAEDIQAINEPAGIVLDCEANGEPGSQDDVGVRARIPVSGLGGERGGDGVLALPAYQRAAGHL